MEHKRNQIQRRFNSSSELAIEQNVFIQAVRHKDFPHCFTMDFKTVQHLYLQPLYNELGKAITVIKQPDPAELRCDTVQNLNPLQNCKVCKKAGRVDTNIATREKFVRGDEPSIDTFLCRNCGAKWRI